MFSRPKVMLAFVLLAAGSAPLHAQTLDDSVMMPKKALFTGFSYGHDSWSDYWEGSLKRDNANVGTLTTQSVSWMATYGMTDRINLLAELPYVYTHASGGTLHGQSGLQDVTVAAKYRFLDRGHFSAFAVGSYGMPVSDYVVDLLPLSIGLRSKRFGARLTVDYATERGFFADATPAYTRRNNITLDRPSYFTDGQLFLSDEVEMPDVFDYAVRVGYMKHGFMIPVTYVQQFTLGGGDIRRQDMPFASNKMNFSRLDGMVMYTLPKTNLAVKVEAERVLTGRNVGQSTTFMAGLMYTLHFSQK
jgi:hypothetical protein